MVSSVSAEASGAQKPNRSQKNDGKKRKNARMFCVKVILSESVIGLRKDSKYLKTMPFYRGSGTNSMNFTVEPEMAPRSKIPPE